jgi:hypothetical protein
MQVWEMQEKVNIDYIKPIQLEHDFKQIRDFKTFKDALTSIT